MNIKKILRPLKVFFIVSIIQRINIYKRRKQFSYIKKHHVVTNEICPICKHSGCRKLTLYFGQYEFNKYFCINCYHVFTSLNLSQEREKLDDWFDYINETKQKNSQKSLIRESIKFSNVEQGNFLDFGVGGNISASQELNIEKCNHNINIYATDIIERKNTENYFTAYTDNNMGIFDGISSNNVIEHLDNTIDAWTYFNRLLKPISSKKIDEKRVMVHAFPSNLHYHLSHWSIIIRSHICIFSDRSLKMLCEQSGFKLDKIKWGMETEFPVFYFIKVRDI